MTRQVRLKAAKGSTLAACALGLAAALSGSVNAHSGREPDLSWMNSKLTGTWVVQVVTYNCSTLVEGQPFTSYLTFGADGTIVETTANPAFQPGQRSAGHGSWERIGRNYYHMASEAFIQFSTEAHPPVPPFKRGRQRLEGGLELTGRNGFTTDSSVTFFDEAGAVVLAGCAKAVGKRFE